MRYAFLPLAALLVSPAIAASAPSTVVHIKNDAYTPSTLTISAGQTVTFINDDEDAHTVTGSDGAYDSKGMDTGGSWRHRFVKPGTYHYFCELHPFMKATIVVKAVK